MLNILICNQMQKFLPRQTNFTFTQHIILLSKNRYNNNNNNKNNNNNGQLMYLSNIFNH